MKNRFILFQRSGVYYAEDTTTGKQTSLRTKDKDDALRLLHVKNEAVHQPAMNMQIAQVYLQHGDPALASRTWQQIMEQMADTKSGCTLKRWQTAMRDTAFDLIRNRKLIETTAEHFLAVLKAGSISTNMFLRRLHNFAANMRWVPLPVLPKPNWPVVRHKERRAITFEEHQKIIYRELKPATRAFYELLWHLGGAQSDIATLSAEDIDWEDRTISYRRHKTGTVSLISFGDEVAAILHNREVALEGRNEFITQRHFVASDDVMVQKVNDAEQQSWLVRSLMRTAFITPEVVKPVQPLFPSRIGNGHVPFLPQTPRMLKLIPSIHAR